MLGFYRAAGPRLGVPAQYQNPDGSSRLDSTGSLQPLAMGVNYPALVENEGLTHIPIPASKAWTCEKLAEILRDCGPCYMRTKLYSSSGTFLGGHILVLVGAKTSTDTVILHDPARGPNLERPIAWLNGLFNWDDNERLKYSMMCKLPPVPNGGTRQRANAMSQMPPTRPRSGAVIGRHRG
jgi:hypothetical protein